MTRADTVLTLDTTKTGAAVSPMLYGLMTEEINHSYDGGIYAELIQNRIFKDNAQTPAHWSVVQDNESAAAITLDETQPIAGTALTTCLRLNAIRASAGHAVGIANDGYWGIPVMPRTMYRASFWAKGDGKGGPLTVRIESGDGTKTFATARVPKITGEWRKYSVTLKTDSAVAPTANARFVIRTETPQTLWFNLVSLFPPTFKNRPNGNRIDLMQTLIAMQPAFLRLPGGNYLEGETVATRFPWKQTLGPLEMRPGHSGTWGYRSSDGMGLLEYMQWCEDMHAEPLLAVFAGYALKHETIAAGPALQPFVDEALDEIEYVTGDIRTKWGAQRAKDGHPKPFPLNYVEIGNEDGFDTQKTYDGRYTQFADAIRARYPRLKLISTVGGKDGLGQRQPLTSRIPDLVDEHYYQGALQMMDNAARYDSYPRTGPKIFVGEWATREGSPTTNLIAALGDAAWMTGMERNADIVTMSCYAPLFVNVSPGAMQWRSDLIGYDALTSYGSPSYWAQKIFREYLGDQVVPLTGTGISTQTWQPATPRNRPTPAPKQVATLFFSATRATKDGKIYLKVVNTIGTAQTVRIDLTGAQKIAPNGTAVTLRSPQPTDTNSITEPTKIVPVTGKVTGLGPRFSYSFPPYSVTVMVLSVH